MLPVVPMVGLETGLDVLVGLEGAGVWAVVVPMAGLETAGLGLLEVCVPLAGLEIGLLAGAGLLGLETPVVGLVTLLALLLGGGLLELGLVTLEAVVILENFSQRLASQG